MYSDYYKIMNGSKEVKAGDKVRLLDGVYNSLQGIDGVVENIDYQYERIFVRFKPEADEAAPVCYVQFPDIGWWDIKDFGFEALCIK